MFLLFSILTFFSKPTYHTMLPSLLPYSILGEIFAKQFEKIRNLLGVFEELPDVNSEEIQAEPKTTRHAKSSGVFLGLTFDNVYGQIRRNMSSALFEVLLKSFELRIKSIP